MKLPRRWSSAFLAGALAAVSACGDASPVGVEFPAPPLEAQLVAPAVPALQFGSPSLSYVTTAQTLGPTGGPLWAGEQDLLARASGISARLSAGAAATANAGALHRARSSSRSYRSNYAVAW